MREVFQVVTDVFVTRMPGVYPGEVREFLTGSTTLPYPIAPTERPLVV